MNYQVGDYIKFEVNSTNWCIVIILEEPLPSSLTKVQLISSTGQINNKIRSLFLNDIRIKKLTSLEVNKLLTKLL